MHALREAPDLDFWTGRTWHSFMRTRPDDARYYRREIGNVRGLDVLEIGFGNGAFLGWARANGAHIFGMEHSAKASRAAMAEGVPLLPPDIRAAALAKPDQFDLIVGLDVFEHLEVDQVALYLRHCARMLRPGGSMVLRFPNAQSPLGAMYQGASATHIASLSAGHIRELSQDAGLDLLSARRPAFIGGKGLRAIVRPVRHFAQIIIERVIQLAYATSDCMSPNVVVRLAKHQKLRPVSNSRSEPAKIHS